MNESRRRFDLLVASERDPERDDVIELADALFRTNGMTLTLLGDFADGFQIKSLS